MYRKIIVGAAATTLALSSAGLALAAGGNDPQGKPSGVRAKTLTPEGAHKCDGGKTLQTWNRIVSSPYTFGEGPAVDVPGAALTFKGPKYGKDTISIAFSGETNLYGSTDSDERWDWMGVEVYVDGVPIQPYTAAGDVYAFAGPGGYDSHAAQFCTKVGPGEHKIRVKLNLKDQLNDDSLSGWIDDYTLHVERAQ